MWVKQKKVVLAFLGSVLIHALALLLFAALLPNEPLSRPDAPIRMEIVQPPEKPPELAVAPTRRPRRKMIDVTDDQEESQAPKDALAESDRDSAARSELAPAGTDNLPSQNGRAIPPKFLFNTRQFVAAESSAQAAATAATAPETAPPLPRPNSQAPRPNATPGSTPPPAPTPLPTAAPDEFAMAEPTPTPVPDFDPFVRQPSTEPPKPTPVAAAARPSRTLTPEEKTLIRGNLSNRGPSSSIAALATPEGRYSKAVSDAISVRWYARISSQMDIASFGTVKIHFSVDRRGKVIEPKVVSNSGNEALASISLAAVMDARLPPVPPEVIAAANSTDLPLDFDFSLY